MWLFIFFFKTTAEPQVAEPRFRFTTVCSTYIQYYCRTENSFSTHKSLRGPESKAVWGPEFWGRLFRVNHVSVFLLVMENYFSKILLGLFYSQELLIHTLSDSTLHFVGFLSNTVARCEIACITGLSSQKNDTRFAALSQSCGSAQMFFFKDIFLFLIQTASHSTVRFLWPPAIHPPGVK